MDEDSGRIEWEGRFKLGNEIALELVQELGLRDWSEALRDPHRPDTAIYVSETDPEVRIIGEASTNCGPVQVMFSLPYIAADIIDVIRSLLSEDKVSRILDSDVLNEIRKRELSMLQFFAVEPEEIEETVRHHAKGGLRMFLINTGGFVEAAVLETLNHAKIGYMTNVLPPLLKEHWREKGFAENFRLLSQRQINIFLKKNIDRKRWFLADRKQRLDMSKLADAAENVRQEYRKARIKHDRLKKSFDEIHTSATLSEWREKWVELRDADFQHLIPELLDEVWCTPPFELATRHLGIIFGYNEETMLKKIKASRKLRNYPR